MNDALNSDQFKRYCAAGNELNAKIESPDFAKIRQGLDDCCKLARQMAGDESVDSYLTTKLTLAFFKGLAITEQREPMTLLVNLGKLYGSRENLFADMASNPTTYDGMIVETRLQESTLRLFGMGMNMISDQLICPLETGDTMVFLQATLLEKVLFKRECQNEESALFSKTDEAELKRLFSQTPLLLINFATRKESFHVCDVMSFWQHALELAYGETIPEDLATIFAEHKNRFASEEFYNYIKLLPMQPWEITKNRQIADMRYAGYEGTIQPVQNGWFQIVPGLTAPITVFQCMYLLVAVLSKGLTTGLFWSAIAFGLAAVFYRVSMFFVDEIRQGMAPYLTLFIYLFISLLSIGAFVSEPLGKGLFAAMIMNSVLPGIWGAALCFKRGIINLFKRRPE